MMDYSSFLEITLKKASDIALTYFGKVNPITKPGDNNQVLTEADLAIGEYIVKRIGESFPEHNIIDEEAGAINNNSEFTWVIDPIEATSNFASGSEDYGIMIGLLNKDQPVVGGIILPSKDVLYYAEKGKGATKNGSQINVTQSQNLNDCLVSFSLDGHRDNPDRTKRECKLMSDVILSARNIRNTNCEAVDTMYVAEGIYGGRINMTSKIWDNVAPQIIVEEAGGLWTELFGNKPDYSNPLNKINKNYTMCVANPTIHKQLQKITKKHEGVL